MISYMTRYMLNLTTLKQFNIETDFKINLSLIICYLIYLIFFVNQIFKINFYNQSLQSIFLINIYLKQQHH